MLFARDYRVVRHLSAGGMGAVYVVEQVSTQRQRALKIMLPDLVRDPRQRERFTQEATVSARIKSDHVVEVVAAGIDDDTGTPWLAMELLEGEDLAARIEKRGPFPAAEAMELFRQLCHGLGAAHRAGLVHRDLKPENIFLAEARREGTPYTVKVLDFGIAKVVGDNRTSASATAALGSPLWMAPEQAEQGQIRPATDVWALGLIAFHVLTGAFYWRSIRNAEFALAMLLKEIFVDPLDAPSQRAAELGRGAMVPPNFDAWFARCVQRDPTQRFVDAAEALAHLLPVLGGAAGVTPNAATWPGPPSPGIAPPAGVSATPMGYGAPGPVVATPPGYGPLPSTQGSAHGYAQSAPQSYPQGTMGWAPGAPPGYTQSASGPVPYAPPGYSPGGYSQPGYAPPPVAARSGSHGMILGLGVGLVVVLAVVVGLVGRAASVATTAVVPSVPGMPSLPGVPTLPSVPAMMGPQCRGTGLRHDVPGTGNAVNVSAGRFHTCATLRDATARCWGWNAQSQLGDDTTEDQYSPVVPQGMAGVVYVGSGMQISCALHRDSTVSCWGNRPMVPQRTPSPVRGAFGATQVSVGMLHACMRRNDGTAWCWGIDVDGALGTNSRLPHADARQVPGLSGVVQVAAGSWHTCALVTGGAVYCWGKQENGQLGNGRRSRDGQHTPSLVLGLSGAVQIAAGDSHTCAVLGDGSVLCWGNNDQGQCGLTGDGPRATPAPVPGLTGIARVTAGQMHTCALHRDGAVSCWGSNGTCQFGSGPMMPPRGPHRVEALPPVVDLSAGGMHTCAVTSQAAVRCWGYNNYGQLGNGSSSANVDHSMQP